MDAQRRSLREPEEAGGGIARIREAEARAERLRAEATEKAAELLEKARYEARKRSARARREAQEEAERLVEEALRGARAEAREIERRGEAEATAVEALAEENFEDTVEFVLKRVFPFPWDEPE